MNNTFPKNSSKLLQKLDTDRFLVVFYSIKIGKNFIFHMFELKTFHTTDYILKLSETLFHDNIV